MTADDDALIVVFVHLGNAANRRGRDADGTGIAAYGGCVIPQRRGTAPQRAAAAADGIGTFADGDRIGAFDIGTDIAVGTATGLEVLGGALGDPPDRLVLGLKVLDLTVLGRINLLHVDRIGNCGDVGAMALPLRDGGAGGLQRLRLPGDGEYRYSAPQRHHDRRRQGEPLSVSATPVA